MGLLPLHKLPSWLCDLVNDANRPRNRRIGRGRRAAAQASFSAEALEPRQLLATTVHWTGASSNNWWDEANWREQRVPNIDDDVVIGACTGWNGPILFGQAEVHDLEVNWPVIISSGNLTVDGHSEVKNSISVGGCGNSGSLSLRGSVCVTGSYAGISLDSGTVDIEASYSGGYIHNEGTLLLSNTSLTSVSLCSTGTLMSRGGTVSVGAGVSEGHVSATCGSTLNLASVGTSTVTVESGSMLNLATGSSEAFTLSNCGTFSLVTGSLSLADDSTSTGTLNIASGTTLELHGTSITAGTINNSGTLKLYGTSITGTNITNKDLLEVCGTSGSVLGATVANSGVDFTGTVSIDSCATLTLESGSITGGHVDNSGTLAVDAGAATVSIVASPTNVGTLEVDSGTLCITGTIGGSSGGRVSVVSGEMDLIGGTSNNCVNISQGAVLLLDGASIDTGPGNRGTINVSGTGNSIVGGDNCGGLVSLQSGADLLLSGNNPLTGGLVTVAAGAQLSVDSSSNCFTLDNAGTVTVSGGLNMVGDSSSSCVITVPWTGWLSNSGSLQLVGGQVDGGYIHNCGGIGIGATTTVNFNASIDNSYSGWVSVGGVLRLAGWITSGTVHSSGEIHIASGTSRLNTSMQSEAGASIVIDAYATLQFSGTGGSAGELQNDGTLSIESGSNFSGTTLTGSIVNTGAASLYSNGNWTLFSGSVDNYATLSATGSGALSGTVENHEGAVLTIAQDGYHYGATSSAAVNNYGAMNATGGGSYWSTSLMGQITNYSSGTLSLGSTSTYNLQLNNLAGGQVSSGGSTLFYGGYIQNAGTLQVQSGSFYQWSAGIDNTNGTIVNNATWRMNDTDITGGTLENAGTIVVNCNAYGPYFASWLGIDQSDANAPQLSLDQENELGGARLSPDAYLASRIEMSRSTSNGLRLIQGGSAGGYWSQGQASLDVSSFHNSGSLEVGNGSLGLGNQDIDNGGGSINIDTYGSLTWDGGSICGGSISNCGTFVIDDQTQDGSWISGPVGNYNSNGPSPEIELTAGSLTLTDGSIYGGYVNVHGGAVLHLANASLSSGQLYNSGTLAVASGCGGLTSMTVNNASGDITIADGATLQVNGGSISGGTISNSGMLEVVSSSTAEFADVSLDNTFGSVAIDACGTMQLDGGSMVAGGLAYGTGTFSNCGTLQIVADTVEVSGEDIANSQGAVTINSGATLSLGSSSIDEGTVNVSGTLQLGLNAGVPTIIVQSGGSVVYEIPTGADSYRPVIDATNASALQVSIDSSSVCGDVGSEGDPWISSDSVELSEGVHSMAVGATNSSFDLVHVELLPDELKLMASASDDTNSAYLAWSPSWRGGTSYQVQQLVDGTWEDCGSPVFAEAQLTPKGRATGYGVRQLENGTGGNYSSTAAWANTQLTIDGLAAGTAYSFRVMAIGARGGDQVSASQQVRMAPAGVDWRLQQTVLIPVDGSAASTTDPLVAGVNYRLRASGEFYLAIKPDGNGDAEYGSFSANHQTRSQYPGHVDYGIAIDNTAYTSLKYPFWGAYNGFQISDPIESPSDADRHRKEDHPYTIMFTGAGESLTFNYHDDFREDNSNFSVQFGQNVGLQVEIYRPVPKAPTELSATPVYSTNTIRLDWTDNAGTAADGFEVFRSDDGIVWSGTPLTTVGSGVTTYTDMTALPNHTYHYRINAYKDTGVFHDQSEPSNVATACLGSGSISGYVFHDRNGNHYWDQPGTLDLSSNPDIVLIVDRSPSMGLDFAGNDPAASQNPAPSRLKGAVVACTALNQQLINLGLGSTANISILGFDSSYMHPQPQEYLTPGFQIVDVGGGSTPRYSTRPAADVNGDGVLDVLQALGSMTPNPDLNEGTDYTLALQKAQDLLQTLQVQPHNAILFFVSDGAPTAGGGRSEIKQLADMLKANPFGATIRALGIADDPDLSYLRAIDPFAAKLSSTEDLAGVFADLIPAGPTNPELGLAGRTVYLDLDNDEHLDAGEPSATTDQNGAYRFEHLAPGTYHVRQVEPASWRDTAPWNGMVGQSEAQKVVLKDGESDPYHIDHMSEEHVDLGSVEDHPAPSGTLTATAAHENSFVSATVASPTGSGPFHYFYQIIRGGKFANDSQMLPSNSSSIVFVPDRDATQVVLQARIYDTYGKFTDLSSLTINVANTPPRVSIVGAPASIDDTDGNTRIGLVGQIIDSPGNFAATWSVTKDGQPFDSDSASTSGPSRYEFIPDGPGTYQITFSAEDARSGQGSATTSILVTTQGPVIVSQPAACLQASGLVADLSLAATDDRGEQGLSYTWSCSGPGGVSYSRNAEHGASATQVTLPAVGSYSFTVAVTDSQGHTTTSDPVVVNVGHVATRIGIGPSVASVAISGTKQFSAAVYDQFGIAYNPSGSLSWSVSGGGTVTSSGAYSAGTAAGTDQVTASLGLLSGSARVTVQPAANNVLAGAARAGVAFVEGTASPALVVGWFIDPVTGTSLSDYSASIDWGDDSDPETGTVGTCTLSDSTSGFTVSGSHTYAASGNYGVTITLFYHYGQSDERSVCVGGTAAATGEVWRAKLASFAPVLDGPFADTVVAEIDDANLLSDEGDFSATIDWGDGTTPSEADISLDSAGHLSIRGGHTYTEIADRTLRVTILHDGQTQTLSGQVHISRQPVDAPSGLHAVGISGSQIYLYWDEEPGAVGYVLWATQTSTGARRCIPGEAGRMIVPVAAPYPENPAPTGQALRLACWDQELPAGTGYSYTIQAIFADGSASAESASASASTQATGTLGAPTGLTARHAIVTGDQGLPIAGVQLFWNPSSAPGYRVFRWNGSGWEGLVNGDYLGQERQSADGRMSYFDAEATSPNTVYLYKVVGYEQTANGVVPSPEVEVCTDAGTTLSTPQNLRAASYPDAIQLSWDDRPTADDDAWVGWNVYRSQDDINWTKINVKLVTSDLGYNDYTAPSGSVSWYCIRSVDAMGNESAASAEVSCHRSTYGQLPAPTGLRAGVTEGTVQLNWDAVSSDSDRPDDALAGYRVYRQNGTTWTLLNSPSASTSHYEDGGRTSGTECTYRVTAVDADGDESLPAEITVNVGSGIEGDLLLTIASPANSGSATVISADTPVYGVVDDPQDQLAAWQLVLSPVSGAGADIVVSTGKGSIGSAPDRQGLLGTIHSTVVPDGMYRLVLQAKRAGATEWEEVSRLVQVKTDLKVGNFTLPLVDLSIDVPGGQPIVVRRVYDSSQANTNGDFGYGWHLELSGNVLQTTARAGTRGDTQMPALRNGDLIYVTIPGLGKYTFEFLPRPQGYQPGNMGNAFNPYHYYTPAFVSVDGSSSRLDVVTDDDTSTISRDGDEFFYDDGEHGQLGYNPARGGRYTLTADDGTKYTIDAATGSLISSSDLNENQTDYYQNSISAGNRSLTIHRDDFGRIDWISTASSENGPCIAYHYNGSGELESVTSLDGKTTTYLYEDADHWHFLTGVQDPRQIATIQVKYDGLGKVSKLVDLTRSTNNTASVGSSGFDGTSVGTGVTDLSGNRTEQICDDRGNVIREIRTIRDQSQTITGYMITVREFKYVNTELYDPLEYGISTYNKLMEQSEWAPFTINGEDLAGLRYTTQPTGQPSQRTTYKVLWNTTDPSNDPDLWMPATQTVLNANGGTVTTTFADYFKSKPQTVITTVGTTTTTTHSHYLANGNLEWSQDALGEKTYYNYTTDGGHNYIDGTTIDYTGLPNGLLLETYRQSDPNDLSTRICLSKNVYYGKDASARLWGRLKSTTDAAGLTTRYTYWDDGQVQATFREWKDSNNQSHAVQDSYTEYDVAGRVTLSQDANGKQTHTYYDAVGQVLVTVDPFGGRTVNTYDVRGNLIRTLSPDGTETRSVYDAMGRVIWSGQRFASDSTYTYTDGDDSVTWTHNDDTATYTVTHTIYDSLGRVSSTERYGGAKIKFNSPDSYGMLTTDIDGIDQENLLSRTSTVSDGAGRTVETRVESTGSPTVRTGTIYYDNGQVQYSGTLLANAPADWYTQTNPLQYFRTQDGDTLVTTYAYDQTETGMPTNAVSFDTATDALNHTTKTYKDALGRAIRTAYDDGSFTETLYSHGDQSITRADLIEPTSSEGWNGVAPGGSEQIKIAQRMASDTPVATYYLYDKAGRLTDVWLPAVDDATTTSTARVRPHWHYTYDANGNQTAQTDPKNHTTTFGYDDQGRRLGRTLPLGQTEHSTYNQFGQQATSVDFTGNTTVYAYFPSGTHAGQLQYKRYYLPGQANANQAVQYGYDDLNRVQTVSEYSGGSLVAVSTYGYDAQSRVTLETLYDESTEDYAKILRRFYDPATGRLLATWTAASLTTATNLDDARDEAITLTEYGYDDLGRLQTTTLTRVNGATVSLATTNTYDAIGNLKTVTQPNNVVTTYDYDGLNRLYHETVTCGTRSIFEQTYTLAADGQRTQVIEERWGNSGTLASTVRTTWHYDGDGRLTAETRDADSDLSNSTPDCGTRESGDYTDTYAFDLAGNRILKQVGWDANNDGTLGTGETVDQSTWSGYDANDRLLWSSADGDDGHDDNGDVAYTYDPNGSTTEVDTVGGPTVKNLWDVRNRLVAVDQTGDDLTIDGNGVASGTVDTGDVKYAYTDDGQRISKEVVGTSAVRFVIDGASPTGYAQVLEERATVAGAPTMTYVLGMDVYGQVDGSGSENWMVYDGHGSARALADSGGLTLTGQTYDYDAFGDALFTGTVTTKLLYCGEYWDGEKGSYFLRARSYDPSIGRFSSFDALQGNNSDPTSLHKYTYCSGSPIGGIDPTGNSEISLAGLVANIGLRALVLGMKTTALFTAYAVVGRTIAGYFSSADTLDGRGGKLCPTSRLLNFRASCIAEFANAKTSDREELSSHTLSLAHLWDGATNWDIDQFFHGMFPSHDYSKDPFYLPGAEPWTVQVENKVYWQAHANYWLFGAMARAMDEKLGGFRLPAAIEMVRDYRSVLAGGGGSFGRVAWTTAGYYGDIRYAEGAALKSATLSSIPYDGWLIGHWGTADGAWLYLRG